jgi:hypothetical protein
MTVHNRRCDCCGDRLPLVPSEIHLGEQYIARGGLGVGATAAPAERPLSTPPRQGRATPRALHSPQHHPDWSGERHRTAHTGARPRGPETTPSPAAATTGCEWSTPAWTKGVDQAVPRARAKSSDRRLTCSDAGMERLRSGAESGPSLRQTAARSL